jgi:LmbE family N-acetylglucosaminyl deacetylase
LTDAAGASLRLWSSDDGVHSVLVVSAHPDDVDFGAAGTVAAMTSAGVAVAYCIVTDGQAGGSDASVSREEMASIRRKEQASAAAEVGVTDLTFLGYPDGRLQPTIELRRDLSRVIRRLRPERVIAQSPERVWSRIFASHPDHLAAGEATVCAVYPDSRNPFAHPELSREGLAPHTVRELWLMAAPRSDIAVDTTATFPRKVAALCSHASQIADPRGLEARVRQWGTAIAGDAGLPEGALAEAFQVVVTG